MEEVRYWIVGGVVRDQILGKQSKDVDFAVEASSYEAMKANLVSKGVEIYLETPEFFTIRGNHPKYKGVDYVLCRKDGQYKDGRHPERVERGTIFDDLARRDFTMNALAVEDATSARIVDPYGGKNDIQQKIIRCVGNPDDRFGEDALRILRAVRFAVKLGFEIEDQTSLAMIKHSEKVSLLPFDRIREELHKSFVCDTVKTIKMLSQYGLLELIFSKDCNLWLMPTNKTKKGTL